MNTWAFNVPHATRPKLPLGMRIAAAGRIGGVLDSLLNLSLQSTFSSRTHRPMGDMAMEAYAFPFRTPASRVAVRAFTQMFYEPDRETTAKLNEIYLGLTKIDAPADILWGARDPVLSKLPAYLLRDSLKRSAEPLFLPDVSHYLPEEAPGALAETVLRAETAKAEKRPDSLFKIL
jgi:pimeloyl-ACP methyl ester carboxylesterase